MASGGARQGTPGKSYPNRTDLNAPKPTVARFQGQTYGEQTAQVAQQQATPPPSAPVSPTVSLDAPTARPDEPLTAGLPIGPGPGPEALGMGLTSLDKLKLMYRKFQDPDLLDLIMYAEDQ